MSSETPETTAVESSPAQDPAVENLVTSADPDTQNAAPSAPEPARDSPINPVQATPSAEDPIPVPDIPTPPINPTPPNPLPSLQTAPVAASEPASEAAVQAVNDSSDSAFTERITIPGTTGADAMDGEGGEWDLLTTKLRDWWDTADVGAQARTLGKPLKLIGALIAALLVFRVYSGLLHAIDSIPLASGLFELAGVIWIVRYSSTRLIRSDERQKALARMREMWTAFTGKD